MRSLTTRFFIALMAVSIAALALGTWWVRRTVEAEFGTRVIVETTVESVNGQDVVRESRRELPPGAPDPLADDLPLDDANRDVVVPANTVDVAQLNRRLLFALTVIVLGAGAVTALVARRVLGPVHALRVAADAMASGYLDARVDVRGTDELAALGRAFNAMAASLADQERLKRDLTNDLAHELRTPLTDLRCHLEALQDGIVDMAPDTLDTLRAEVAHLERLVEDLGDLAQAEARALRLSPEDVQIVDVVPQLVRQATPRASALGVHIQSPPIEPGLTVWADRSRLHQVMTNLIDNALVHTPAGGSITVTASRDGSRDRSDVRMEVVDTGSGIAPEHLPHVFDRFYRADPSRSRSTGGVGLGLAIARQMVEAADGRIEVESVPGSGTTFRIYWPSGPSGLISSS